MAKVDRRTSSHILSAIRIQKSQPHRTPNVERRPQFLELFTRSFYLMCVAITAQQVRCPSLGGDSGMAPARK
jgi:hypothetical protein